ncbi:MAG: 4Fe-4S binding protein [Fibrobacterota bacterium]
MKKYSNRNTLRKFLTYAAICLFFAACLHIPTDHSFLSVNTRQCVGCGDCSNTCPTTAISVIEGTAFIDPSECIECGKCVEVCNWDAIY